MLTLAPREKLSKGAVALLGHHSGVRGMQPAENVQVANAISQIQDLEVTSSPRS